MSESKTPAEQPAFPRRDEHGRMVSLTEMVAFILMVLAIGVVMLAALDGVFWLLGMGPFGQISGWISGLIAVFVFVDDFKAWRFNRVRWVVALVGIVLAVVTGMGLLTLLPPWWWPLLNGALAVTIAALLYAVLWFTGVRLLGGENP